MVTVRKRFPGQLWRRQCGLPGKTDVSRRRACFQSTGDCLDVEDRGEFKRMPTNTAFQQQKHLLKVKSSHHPENPSGKPASPYLFTVSRVPSLEGRLDLWPLSPPRSCTVLTFVVECVLCVCGMVPRVNILSQLQTHFLLPDL